MDQSLIRNFSIIAHIDHGKSTLADRLLEVTGTIESRQMSAMGGEQVLDSMDLERERGITIKAAAVRMSHTAADGQAYELNLIDTPGHVDFTYEVSRALAACEGALLVVDASQGIEAQTLANVYMALDLNLTIIPVVNKIDLDSAEPERVAQELVDVIGFNPDEVLYVSAKEGTNIDQLLEAVVDRIPPPSGNPDAPLRALIFDSKYDSYKGVMAYVRVIDGHIVGNNKLRLMATRRTVEPLETGALRPGFSPTDGLDAGEVGYVATGLKTVRDVRVGDTVTSEDNPTPEPLPGYNPAKPMVFAGLYPVNAEEYELLRDAIDKLQLNDAALQYQPENSVALGPGYRAGFLGLLHMDIVQERLEREYDLDILATAPSVAYRVRTTDGVEVEVDSPADMPDPSRIDEIFEPWMNVSIVAPSRFIGPVMELVTGRRGTFKKMEYLEHAKDPHADTRSGSLQASTGGGAGPGQAGGALANTGRVLLEYEMPLSEMLVDFYDELKSRTQGYASLDYHFLDYRAERLVKVDILINAIPVDALSMLIHVDYAQRQGRQLVERLRSLIPRQMFEVPIQAAIGGKIIARESVKALRKNVLAKCYGGDVTRKRKLLEKQKKGKKRMKRVGNVEIPQEAFMSLLKIGK